MYSLYEWYLCVGTCLSSHCNEGIYFFKTLLTRCLKSSRSKLFSFLSGTNAVSDFVAASYVTRLTSNLSSKGTLLATAIMHLILFRHVSWGALHIYVVANDSHSQPNFIKICKKILDYVFRLTSNRATKTIKSISGLNAMPP